MEIKPKQLTKYVVPFIIITQLSVIMIWMSKKTVTECRAVSPTSLVCAQL